ncbi:ferrous iron transport protein A [Chloroflexota bacterium]
MASSGDTVEVAAFRGGWGLQRRLADLGLYPGVKVRVASGGGSGQVVIDVRGSKLALGRGVANKIMVVAGQDK